MALPPASHFAKIPRGLVPHFQEYDVSQLDFANDANLIIQRTLEFGTWDEIRWLLEVYGSKRVRAFLREHGQRWLNPVTFHYWRKLFRLRRWKPSPFPTPKGTLWTR
ncbi:MAG: hypothetical protein OHK0041_00580 [Anaerolineales bacterium]